MKRKKWTEEEERTLLAECSSLLSSGSLARLRTREKKFQPIAERVNAAHHLRDPAAFPFRWSWRDVSVKVQNMRHQYLGVKLKVLRRDTDSFDWDHGLLLWPNFLRYKHVFGDLPLDRPPATSPSDIDLQIPFDSGSDESDDDDDGNHGDEARTHAHGADNKSNDHHHHRHHHDDGGGGEVDLGDRDTGVAADRDGGRLGRLASRVAELGEMELKREERRREREAAREEENAERERRHQREVERWRSAVEEEERRERRRRKWEVRREEEEMEWRERVEMMRMEHERQVMQMNADAGQAQMHVLAILVRLVCQFLGPGAGGGDGGLTVLAHQVMHNLQHQQQDQESPESLVGDDGKNDAHSAGHYL